MTCIGCGKDIPGPENENESGEWCPFGDCDITDFEGVNRLRQAFLDTQPQIGQMKKKSDTCSHEGVPCKFCGDMG